MRVTISFKFFAAIVVTKKSIARKERNLIAGFLRVNDLKHKNLFFCKNSSKNALYCQFFDINLTNFHFFVRTLVNILYTRARFKTYKLALNKIAERRNDRFNSLQKYWYLRPR